MESENARRADDPLWQEADEALRQWIRYVTLRLDSPDVTDYEIVLHLQISIMLGPDRTMHLSGEDVNDFLELERRLNTAGDAIIAQAESE